MPVDDPQAPDFLAYLPTIWALQASGDASQHSLWTWPTWLGSNLTMAAVVCPGMI